MKNARDKRYRTDGFISFKELLWTIAEQWKILLIIAVIAALCCAGIMINRVRKTNNSAANQVVSQEDLLQALSEKSRTTVQSAFRMYQAKNDTQNYITTSPLMKLQPYNVERVRISWTIKAPEDQVKMLSNAYAYELRTSDSVQEMIAGSGIDLEYKQFLELMNFYYNQGNENGHMSLEIYLAEGMDAQKLITATDRLLQKIHKKTSSSIGQHDLIVLSEESVNTVDSGLETRQKMEYDILSSLISEISTVQNSFTPEENKAYESLINPAVTPVNTKATVSKRLLLRNMILSGLFGCLVYTAILFVWLIFSGRIYVADSVRSTGLPSLGEWYADTAGTGNKFKRLFLKSHAVYARHHRGQTDEEEALDSITEEIRGIGKYREASSLLAITTAPMNSDHSAFIDRLKEHVEKLGMRLTVLDLQNEEKTAFNSMIEADGVIPIIVREKTRIRDMEEILDYAGRYDASVLGSVFLG